MTTGEIIKQRRKELGYSAELLAEKLNVSRSTIFRYENGDIEKMPIDTLEPLSKILSVSPAYLMGWTEDDEKTLSNIMPVSTQRVPLLGTIAAGEPIFADEDRESYVEIGTNIKADFCLRVKGDSMINARINDGDIVFIHKQEMVKNGEIAAVIIDDNATLKRVYYYPDKQKLLLNPENPSYEPFIYIGEELAHIRILGKAIAFQSDVV